MGKGRKVARHADRQRWKICGVSPIRAQAIDLIDPGLLSPRSRPHFFGCRKSADLSAGDAVCTELSHKSAPTRLRYVRGPRRVPPSRAAIVAVGGVVPPASIGERVRPHLQLEHLRLRIDATFAVEVGAGAGGGP